MNLFWRKLSNALHQELRKATTRAARTSPLVYRLIRIAALGSIGPTVVVINVYTGTQQTCRLEACPRRYDIGRGAQIQIPISESAMGARVYH